MQFAALPENFNYKEYNDIDVNAVALSLGIDPQDVQPLSGGSFGTGTQSAVLADKARRKAEGYFYRMITRTLNLRVLPDYLEFAFNSPDAEADAEEASNAQVWAGFVSSVSDVLGATERRQLLADKVPAVADVIATEDGVLALPSEDVVTDTGEELSDAGELPSDVQQAAPSFATFASDEDNEPPPTSPTTTPTLESLSNVQAKVQALAERYKGERVIKEWATTRARFTRAMTQFLLTYPTGLLQFDARLTDLLSEYGALAYQDGLRFVGAQGELNAQDRLELSAWLQEQQAFISNLYDELQALPPEGDINASYRAELWANNSLNDAYQLGIENAGKQRHPIIFPLPLGGAQERTITLGGKQYKVLIKPDGAYYNNKRVGSIEGDNFVIAPDAVLYEWRYGDTEHCSDCLRLNGQRHTYSAWRDAGWLPKRKNLECKGYNCQCNLIPVLGLDERGGF